MKQMWVQAMSRRFLKVLLLSSALAVPAVAGFTMGAGPMAATAQTTGSVAKTSGKTQDRLRIASAEFDVAAADDEADLDDAAPPEAAPPAGRERGPSGRGDRRPSPRAGRDAARALDFAGTLAAAETALGIRADQLDAWRNFTDALQAAVRPPAPPAPGAVGPGNAAPSPIDRLTTRLRDNGTAGDRLQKALAGLRGHLTPEQLVSLARIEPALLPPPPPPPPPCGGPGARGPRSAPPLTPAAAGPQGAPPLPPPPSCPAP